MQSDQVLWNNFFGFLAASFLLLCTSLQQLFFVFIEESMPMMPCHFCLFYQCISFFAQESFAK
jgi:hypothetical protein